jgi:hypothetical protein
LTIGVWTGAETFTETWGSGSDGAEVPDDDVGRFGTFTLTAGAFGGMFTLTDGAFGGFGRLTGGAWGRSGAGADEGGLPPASPR